MAFFDNVLTPEIKQETKIEVLLNNLENIFAINKGARIIVYTKQDLHASYEYRCNAHYRRFLQKYNEMQPLLYRDYNIYTEKIELQDDWSTSDWYTSDWSISDVYRIVYKVPNSYDTITDEYLSEYILNHKDVFRNLFVDLWNVFPYIKFAVEYYDYDDNIKTDFRAFKI